MLLLSSSNIPFLSLREIRKIMPFVMSQNCEMQVANGAESNQLNRIFANKESCGKRFGAPLCRRQSKQSEGALVKSGGTLKFVYKN